jgi:hypothetical protein
MSNKFRSNYKVSPGLYAVGTPLPASPVFATANYRYSFDCLRTSLKGIDAWILILDTKGINVWCAAGKGTFSTKELVTQINKTSLSQKVSHKSIIVPQLGAPGISAFTVQKETGFKVVYGPVQCRDIPAFLKNDLIATQAMRTVTFTLWERAILIPMEIALAIKKGFFFWVVTAIILGLTPEGILFDTAWTLASPMLLPFLVAVFCGSVLQPLILPVMPMRAFSLQGFVLGALAAIPFMSALPLTSLSNICLLILIGLGMPLVSSYLSFNFTGCTPFTNKSGVKKELKIAWPFFLVTTGIIGLALIVYKLAAEGVL